MTIGTFNSAKALVSTRDQATLLQGKLNTVGAKVVIIVTNAQGVVILAEGSQLSETLGSLYTTVAATALASLSTNLQTVITNSTASLTAL